MSSTILYKFRSGQTFEALPLPGSAARLFDVKKGIVIAKKLDQGNMDFDLSVRDATTNEEYTDDAMLLPRGTRLVVKRLPVPLNAKGQGLLAKISRSQYFGINSATASITGHTAATSVAGGVANHLLQNQQTGAPHDFYTIDGSVRDDDDEFVSSTAQETDEEKELAALKAATESAAAASNSMSVSGMGRGLRPNVVGFRSVMSTPGSGGVSQPPIRSNMQISHSNNSRYRPNADPELREQEKQGLPKKRATGIPRTFLNLKASSVVEGALGDGAESSPTDNVPLLQPNTIGFEELVHRGGGQSENASGTKRDFAYALKLTATEVPDYLLCPLCHTIVKNAMILTWDEEGRTTCEKCIRDALTNSGFRCPLTGQEGASPDDLIPNKGLRKAASEFVKDVMSKMEEIEKHQVDDEIVDTDTAGKTVAIREYLDGGSDDKGVILSRRVTAAEQRKKLEEYELIGKAGDDPFGGDVFAVQAINIDCGEHDVDELGKVVAPDSTSESNKQVESGRSISTTRDGLESPDMSNAINGDEKIESKARQPVQPITESNDCFVLHPSRSLPDDEWYETRFADQADNDSNYLEHPSLNDTNNPDEMAVSLHEYKDEDVIQGNDYGLLYHQSSRNYTETGRRIARGRGRHFDGGRTAIRRDDQGGRKFRAGDNSGRSSRFAYGRGRGQRYVVGRVGEGREYNDDDDRFSDDVNHDGGYADRSSRISTYTDGTGGRGGQNYDRRRTDNRHSDNWRAGKFSDNSDCGALETVHQHSLVSYDNKREKEGSQRYDTGRGYGRSAQGSARSSARGGTRTFEGGQEGNISYAGRNGRDEGRFIGRGGRGRSYEGRSRGGRIQDYGNRFHPGRMRHSSYEEANSEITNDEFSNAGYESNIVAKRNHDEHMRAPKRPRSGSDARSEDASTNIQQPLINRHNSGTRGGRNSITSRGNSDVRDGRFTGGSRGRGSHGGRYLARPGRY